VIWNKIQLIQRHEVTYIAAREVRGRHHQLASRISFRTPSPAPLGIRNPSAVPTDQVREDQVQANLAPDSPEMISNPMLGDNILSPSMLLPFSPYRQGSADAQTAQAAPRIENGQFTELMFPETSFDYLTDSVMELSSRVIGGDMDFGTCTYAAKRVTITRLTRDHQFPSQAGSRPPVRH
jgi:hypothetical protein